MNCDHIENLLPAYADSDLTVDEKAQVDTHLNTCESCRESLAFFTQLETSLTARRTLRPSDSMAAARIVRRIGIRPERRFLPGLTGLPAMVSGALIVLGIAMLLTRDAVQGFFSRVGTLEFSGDFGARLSALLERLTIDFDAASVGSEWTWAVAYLGVLALILLSGSWMVLRYVRE